jgi:glycosyltransferase involved in cell wall biosynthesis
MRILSLTAGAASMYCGSCLRDNALATELIARGHDVTQLPVYTPTLTDEPNVSGGRVFFGGVSVYLQQHFAFFRHSPRWLDKLWDSSRFIRFVSRRSIQTDGKFLGGMTVSMLKGEHGLQRKELDKLIDWLKTQPRPDVVILPFALLIGLARPIREALGAKIVCTLQGEDLFLEQLVEPWKSEAKQLIRDQVGEVDLFTPTSDYYRDYTVDYLGVPLEKQRTVPLGLNFKDFDYLTPFVPHREPRELSPQWPEPKRGAFTIAFLGRIAPEKGLDQLAEAYVKLRREYGLPASKLEAAGWMGADQKPYLEKVQARLRKAGLLAEFAYRGELDRLEKVRFLARGDVFSMPAPYQEPKGFTILEAMAAGVPVVQPAHGAFTEMVRKTGGGLLVKPDDSASLAEGIWQLFQDRRRRLALGRQAAGEVRAKYSVKQSAERLEAVLREATAAVPAGSSAEAAHASTAAKSEAAGPSTAAKEERARAAR